MTYTELLIPHSGSMMFTLCGEDSFLVSQIIFLKKRRTKSYEYVNSSILGIIAVVFCSGEISFFFFKNRSDVFNR